MSEQEKIVKAAEAGAFVSGGIGSATAQGQDGNVSPATSLGAVAGATFGVTTGQNAVNPTGTSGGILAPEQARRFIDYVWDATVLAKDGRRVTMRANTMEIEKVNVGERVIRAAAQADESYTNAGATFTKVELTTKKIRLDWEVSTESLEDNIEGAALEDRLVRLMTFLHYHASIAHLRAILSYMLVQMHSKESLRIMVPLLMQLHKHSQLETVCFAQKQTVKHILMVALRHSVVLALLVFSELTSWRSLTIQMDMSI